MLSARKFVVLVFCVGCAFASLRGADDPDIDISSQIRDKYLVILCAERDFDSVKREAEKVSNALGVQFSMGGNIWDPNRGLIFPMTARIQSTAANTYRGATTSWILVRQILSDTFLSRNQMGILICERVITLLL